MPDTVHRKDTERPIDRLVTAHHQREGAGFIVRRPFPTYGFEETNPFLLLDEMGPVEYGPAEAIDDYRSGRMGDIRRSPEVS